VYLVSILVKFYTYSNNNLEVLYFIQNSANSVLRIRIFMLTKTNIYSVQIFLEGTLFATVAITLGIFFMAQKG